MKQSEYSRPISLRKIQVTDTFWKREMELVREEVIPYQWEALNDRVEGAAPSFCMRNFELAGKLTKERKAAGEEFKKITYPTNIMETLPENINQMEDRFYGFVFQDSDFAKWIEAVGYSLTQHPDDQLEHIADKAIEVVCAAQQENGYLDTYYIINNLDAVYTNLKDNHELYCFGHLAEGAVAYYEATGKDALLKATERYADYIQSIFGEEEGKKRGYPGHEIAEMALIRLYEVTGQEKYLKLGQFFVEERGRKPYYFDVEHNIIIDNTEELRYQYHQAHLPVREQKEAVGHAVRAVYLYSGMADIARITQDESLYQACRTLWDNMVNEKMYITGGIGSTHVGEAFTFPYDLPNDTAYAETCASIGLVFFARRMLEMKADAVYANVMERALYNGILSGMAQDGKSFFYVNPLEVLPEACHKDERKFHVKPVRQKWFGCACCPPNIARLLSSIGTYGFTESADTLYVHLYMGSKITKVVDGKQLDIQIESAFPWEGNVSIQVNAPEKTRFTLALRLPDWCTSPKIDALAGETETKEGYYYITKEWSGTETILLDFPMEIQRITSSPKVRENIGKIAMVRGPIVYCLEEADNGAQLHLVSSPKDTIPNAKKVDRFNQSIVVLEGKGKRMMEQANSGLYSIASEIETQDTMLTWIPYYSWANRGEGEMLVWVRQ